MFSLNKYFQVILGSAEEVPCEVIQDVPGLFRLQDHEEPQPGSYVHVGLKSVTRENRQVINNLVHEMSLAPSLCYV